MARQSLLRVALVFSSILFLSLAVAQQPVKVPPAPAINPALARLDVTAGGLDGPGFALAAHEQSGMIAVGCEEGTIRYWTKDVAMGIRSGDGTPNVLSGHLGPVLALAWSKSGTLASAGADQKIIIWDIAAAQPRLTMPAGTVIRALAVSPDGKLLAGAGEDIVIHLWDMETGKPLTADSKPVVLTGHTDWVLCLAFSADGKLLASGGHDGTARLWDTTSRKKLLDITVKAPPAPNTLPEPPAAVSSLAFSPDGKQLAAGNMDAEIHVFTALDGKYIRSLAGHTSTITGLAFHSTGTLLASSSKDRTLRLWNPVNGQLIKALEGHGAWVEGLALIADGTRLASVSADRTMRVWDLRGPVAR